jgi:hypothetical protein
MASTYTPLGVELQATGENAGTWGTKTNTNLQIIEQIAGGYVAKSIAGGAQTTALAVSDGSTGAELSHRMIEFTGTITGNQIVTIPIDVQTFYFLRNSTSGGYTVQFKYATGSGSTVTFATTDKGDKIVIATANDGTNPDIKEVALGIASVAADTTPQLGGDLDMNGQDIVTTSNADIELAPNGTGHVTVKGNDNQGTIQFNCENNSHGQQVKAAPHSESASNVLTLPSTGGDARLVSATSTATLTNKTLTAPKIADAGFIADANGNEQIIFQTTASAVNELEVTNAATGNNPAIAASGGDTNVGLEFTAKGSGYIKFNDLAYIPQQALTSSSNAVAWDVQAKPNAYHLTTENTTFAAPTNSVEGSFICLEINYNGSHTIAFNTVFEFAASTAPTFTSTDGKTDILVFRYNGAVWQEVGRTLNLSES